MLSVQTMTTQQFEVYAALPENAGKRLEFIGGRVIEVVSNTKASRYAARLLAYLGIFVEENRLGFLTGADGGYQLGPHRVIPDCAFVSAATHPLPPDTAYAPFPPDLAVEVISSTDSVAEFTIKLNRYVAAGVIVWVVYPDHGLVMVHQAGETPRELGTSDTLSGEPVLPGFRLPLEKLFRD